MTNEKNNTLIHRPETSLVGPGRASSPVLTRMTQDVLARARASSLIPARFRIGEYLLREPDYRQILLWAEALGMAPEAVLGEFAGTKLRFGMVGGAFKPMEFAVEDGAIVSLPWESAHLPRDLATWEPGLLIRQLGLRGKWTEVVRDLLSADLPRLETLVCAGLRLVSLDLTHMPLLSELSCGFNHLTSLDLSPVPGLTKLNCIVNSIKILDLSPVPQLTDLFCWSNQLTKLDLPSGLGLTHIYCFDNQLTQLDLTPVRRLTHLNCYQNRLTELDLSPVPGLATLKCDQGVRLLSAPPNLEVERVQRQ